jgi:peptide/nickel transport system permease protein
MLTVVARRLLGPLATIVVASFVISVALSLAPGDPAARLAGPHASPAKVALIGRQLGLDHSPLVRYGDWVADVFHGSFGRSIVYRTPVTTLIGPRIGTTLALVAYSTLLICIVGIGLGMIGGALRPLRTAVAALTGVGIALPTFVASILLIDWFALDLGWLPATGGGSGFLGQVRHLTLPAVSLAIGWVSYVAQITKTAVAEEGAREHVAAATGRGLRGGTVFRRHVARNAAVPIVTISGITVAGLFAGAVVVESAFGLNGIGSLLVQSVSLKDYNVVQAISVIMVVLFVAATATIDLLQTALDPRLRRPASGKA